MINVNCIHVERGIYCACIKVKKSLGGLGMRMCSDAAPEKCKPCAFRQPFVAPDPPRGHSGQSGLGGPDLSIEAPELDVVTNEEKCCYCGKIKKRKWYTLFLLSCTNSKCICNLTGSTGPGCGSSDSRRLRSIEEKLDKINELLEKNERSF